MGFISPPLCCLNLFSQVVIRVSSGAVRDGRCDVLISVQDTGIGIPVDQQSKLFQPFFQGKR